MELNIIYNESNIETCKRLSDNSIDLVVTSPPYDNLRDYKGFVFDFDKLAKELFRVIKDGGVVVWIVNDATINGGESCTSFKQALYFVECGFKLHDTMIYEKTGSAFPAKITSKRYTQVFEYMFIFVKGSIRDDIKLIADKKNKWSGYSNWGQLSYFNKDGSKDISNTVKTIHNYSLRNNIWTYTPGFNDKTGHPAVFPEQLAEDHILSWSVEGDVVYDPFMGSGTTAKMAMLNNRYYIGSEISSEYCEIIKDRLHHVEKYGNDKKFDCTKKETKQIDKEEVIDSLF